MMSSGEVHTAKFFATVWLGTNRYGSDLIEAVPVID